MQLIRYIDSSLFSADGCVLAIGNFDGVHLGHQQLIASLIQKASALGVPAVLMSFEPSPEEFFRGEDSAVRLMCFREKWQALEACGIDYFYCARFTQALSLLEPVDFVKTVLVRGLSVKHLIVGDDFRFGAKRAGDYQLLTQLGVAYDFTVSSMPTYQHQMQRVSSSRIRHALSAGDVSLVAQLLGRPYTLVGRVVSGDQRGRELGFPTANIPLHRRVAPLMGIFAVEVLCQQKTYQGAASIGIRPMYRVKQPLLEVYLLDFDAMIYGEILEVRFLAKIRDELDFKDEQSLIAQMYSDISAIRDFFKNNHST